MTEVPVAATGDIKEGVRASQIASLKNEPFMKLREAVTELYRNCDTTSFLPGVSFGLDVDTSVWSLLSKDQQAERNALLKEVKALKEAFDQEYVRRVFRDQQEQFRKILSALQPQASTGRRLIAINAAAVQGDQEMPEDEQAWICSEAQE